MDDVAEIKNRLGITEVVGAYVPLKQAGRNLKSPCPFHQEKTASFMVSPERGIYHCFGCGEGGDIFSFVMKMEGLDFRAALEKLAAQAGVELQARPEDQRSKKQRERLLAANELATKYFHQSLAKNPKALKYLSERGLRPDAIKEFRLGYAPEAWEALSGFLQKQGFTADELLKAGLVSRKSGRRSIYDLFRGRIVFPIADRDGRVIGFSGRVLGDDQPKYLNTPQTPLYDKSAALFGFNLAREAIRKSDEVVLVEGNMDVIASHQAGVRQVVAASGTALTLEQLRLVSKLTRNVKLAFDSDRAGLAATERAIELGQQLGLTVQTIIIPEAKDADELIKRQAADWPRAIAAAKPALDYLLERFEQEYDLRSAVGKRQYTDRVLSNLRRLADAVERDHYVQIVATKLETAPEAITEKISQSESAPSRGRQTVKPQRAKVQSPSKRASGREEIEELLLALCLTYPQTRLSLDDLEPKDFANDDRQAILAALRDQPDTPGETIALGLTELTDKINILLLRGEESYGSLAPADRSLEAFQLARRLRNVSNREQKSNLSQRLRAAEEKGDASLVRLLLKEYQTILTDEEV